MTTVAMLNGVTDQCMKAALHPRLYLTNLFAINTPKELRHLAWGCEHRELPQDTIPELKASPLSHFELELRLNATVRCISSSH